MSTKPRPVTSLLNALVLTCLVPGILAVIAFTYLQYRAERERLAGDTLQIARALGEAVDAVLLRDHALVQQLTGDDNASPNQLDQLAASLVGLANLGNRALYLLDQGQAIRVAGGAGLPESSLDEEALRSLQAGRVSVSEVLASPNGAGHHIVVHVPATHLESVRHVLGSTITASELTEIVKAYSLRPGWLASVLDTKGTVAGRSRGADKFVGHRADPRLRSAIQHSDAGSLSTVTLDGVANMTAYVRSQRTGYTTVVGVPRDQLVGPLLNGLLRLATGAALLFGLCILLARYLSRRITGSIHALIPPASALGRGMPVAPAQMHLSETVEVGRAIERAANLLRERDETVRVQQEDLQQFKFFSENANEMLLLLDDAGRIRYANRMAGKRLGYTNAELLSMTLFQIDLPMTPERLHHVFAQCRAARLPPFERVYTCKDGTTVPVEITATVLEHRGEWLMHVVPRDIGERRLAEQALRWAATHDALTGIPNRAHALDVLREVLARVGAGAPGGALLYIDLGRFKPVNDNYGHEAGDRVLQELARRLASHLREGELLARFGGDEFVAILPALKDGAIDAAQRADAMLAATTQPVKLGKIEVQLSACIGISRFPEDGVTENELVHAADLAMLHVKQRGGAAYAVYSPEMDAHAQFVRLVERRLRHALDHGGLRLHYQPLVDLDSGRIEGVEALVRLEDGMTPALGPAEFIPIAESCGLIGELGEWVAHAACRQQVRWRESGLPLKVAVNVSALQFRRQDFARHVQALIDASGIDPQHLTIELTESAIMENLADAVGILRALKSIGVRIALDDFGTGYSSLSSLALLPLDKLKIDQSFVRGIAGDDTARAIIDAIITLGTSLGLELVAEGIETEADLRYLRERGCQQGQGYYFSKPLPDEALAAWHARRQT